MPSTVIQSYQFRPDEQRLRITDLSGAIFDYFGVPQEVYSAMKAFKSKSAFVNR